MPETKDGSSTLLRHHPTRLPRNGTLEIALKTERWTQSQHNTYTPSNKTKQPPGSMELKH